MAGDQPSLTPPQLNPPELAPKHQASSSWYSLALLPPVDQWILLRWKSVNQFVALPSCQQNLLLHKSLWSLMDTLISKRGKSLLSRSSIPSAYWDMIWELTEDKHNIPKFTALLSCLPPSYKPLKSVTTVTEQDRRRENSSTKLSSSLT